ncbi:MAG: hypothetical protein ACKOC5_07405 [Chloroflexota bacterium]
MTIANRVLRLRPGEAGTVLTMGLVLIINFLAQQISEITAISNFLSNVGGNWILLVWIVDSVVILVSMGLQSLIIDRFNRIRLMRIMILVFGLFFLLVRGLFYIGAPDWLCFGLWYLLATQQLVFFPVIFWILANDMFDMAQATRLVPLITSLGFVGRLLGIGVSLAVPPLMSRYALFKPEGLLYVSAVLYLLALLSFSIATRSTRLRQTTVPHETVKETLSEGRDFVREVPAFRYLAIGAMALLACDVFIEFRFLVASGQAYPDPGSYQTFYALYRLALTVLAMLIQGLLTSRIITSITLKNTFMVKPVATFLGSLLMLFSAGLFGAVGGGDADAPEPVCHRRADPQVLPVAGAGRAPRPGEHLPGKLPVLWRNAAGLPGDRGNRAGGGPGRPAGRRLPFLYGFVCAGGGDCRVGHPAHAPDL